MGCERSRFKPVAKSRARPFLTNPPAPADNGAGGIDFSAHPQATLAGEILTIYKIKSNPTRKGTPKWTAFASHDDSKDIRFTLWKEHIRMMETQGYPFNWDETTEQAVYVPVICTFALPDGLRMKEVLTSKDIPG